MKLDEINYYVDFAVEWLEKYTSAHFDGENKKAFDLIYAFFSSLQEEARESGLSSDIKFIDMGRYSCVFQVGDQVLKIGGSRNNNDILYHPRMIQSKVRRYFDEYGLFIEVQPFAINKDIPDITAYYLQKEVYEDGIRWEDMHVCNIVRLMSDNIHPYPYITSEGAKYCGINMPINEAYIMKKDDYVFCDTDYFDPLFRLSSDEKIEAEKYYVDALNEIKAFEAEKELSITK